MRNSSLLKFYPMVAVALALIVGVVVGGRWCDSVAEWLWIAVAVAALVPAALCRRNGVLATISLFVAVVSLGAWRSSVAERSAEVVLPDEPLTYDAIVVSEPQVRGRTLRCDLVVTSLSTKLRVKASILCDTVERRYEHLHLGDGLKARSILEQPHSYGTSHFDYGRYLRVHGYHAQTFIYYNQWTKARLMLRAMPLADRVRLRMNKLRSRLLASAHSELLAPESRAVLSAVALGDRTGLDKTLRARYADAGAAHVLALSGMHLAVIYMVLMVLLLGVRRNWLGELLLLWMVWTYVLLTGMAPSLVRSATMLTVYATLRTAHRGSASVNVLAFTAAAMLVVNPLMLYDAGFQLSFLSVLGILTLLPLLDKLMSAKLRYGRNVGRWLASLLLLPVSAQLATAPLVAYYFGQLPTYFLISNLVAVPLLTVMLPLAAVYFLTTSLPAINHVAGRLLEVVINTMNEALGWVSNLPGATASGLSPSVAEVLAAYVLIVVMWLLLRRYVRRMVVASVGMWPFGG